MGKLQGCTPIQADYNSWSRENGEKTSASTGKSNTDGSTWPQGTSACEKTGTDLWARFFVPTTFWPGTRDIVH